MYFDNCESKMYANLEMKDVGIELVHGPIRTASVCTILEKRADSVDALFVPAVVVRNSSEAAVPEFFALRLLDGSGLPVIIRAE